ncbi:hypothetical protein AO282_06185 [Pseudomonas amygdali pv. morsprunorum]|nr:hypothetical protein AO282_06185 [Pseudomonas amygdali pv. morsprunorum]
MFSKRLIEVRAIKEAVATYVLRAADKLRLKVRYAKKLASVSAPLCLISRSPIMPTFLLVELP